MTPAIAEVFVWAAAQPMERRVKTIVIVSLRQKRDMATPEFIRFNLGSKRFRSVSEMSLSQEAQYCQFISFVGPRHESNEWGGPRRRSEKPNVGTPGMSLTRETAPGWERKVEDPERDNQAFG
jgi:hypothetical protein